MSDNNVLENLLPGVVDGALGIVLAAQGPDTSVTSSNANSSQAETQSSNIPDCTPVDSLVNLPGQYRLIFDEATGYCYSK